MSRNRMRYTAAIIGTICIAAFAACKGQQKDTGSVHKPTDEPTVYKGVADKNCAAEMSFGSYASGIDSEAYQKTLNLVGRWLVQYTSTSLGREGETRLCFPLTELKENNKRVFIDSLKIIAKGGQLVS